MASIDIKKKLDMFLNEKFQHERLENVIGDRFGRYSKYIIQERAIPDIRDGLKPVQRRILYAMNELGITANAPYKKSARIAGEVMGKYHPHGDSSIYEALVHMSQSWKMGVTLIDMHGNNGSMDGDGPAAMRYTEARMSKNAEYLLKDIEKNTVPFIPNFDEEEQEPTVLPAKFPNLLVNGSFGISSGYSTNIPPHNLNEIVEATIYKIDHPNMTIDDLLKIVKGPDFPTGGIVQGIDGIREAFLTGAGSVVVRSKYAIEQMGTDQERIVITEVPFGIEKAKTVEKIAQLKIDNKLPDVLDVRDESDREGLRIAIDLKKGANALAILTYIFKNTDLQIKYTYNMVSICDMLPKRLGVLPILDAYINHQKEVITNRTNFELDKAKKRLHIVEGLIKMVSILDEVIKTIRASKNKADSKENLVNKFGFTPTQAEAIVTMQLYRLSSTDVQALLDEQAMLNENIKRYNLILENEKELLKVIKSELKDINKAIVTPRKSVVEDEVEDLKIDETDLISKEQTMVCISKEGYIKRCSIKSFNASKQNQLKENDAVIFLNEVSTLDTMLIFTNLGNYIYLPVYKITECKMKDIGSFVGSYAPLAPKEKIVQVFAIDKFDPLSNVLFATNKGMMKQTQLSLLDVSRYNKTIRAMKLSMDEELVSVDITNNPLEIFAISKNCEGLRFRASEISLYGTQAGGVKSINLKLDDELVKAFYTNKNEDLLIFTSRGNLKRMKVCDVPLTKRSRSGNTLIKMIKANPHYAVGASNLTANQYKEDVNVHLIYTNGNDEINAYQLKYNVSDAGKCIMKEELGKPVGLYVDKASNEEIVSGDYLYEAPREDLFTMGIEDDTPLVAPTKPKKDLLSELDAILGNKDKENDKTIITETDASVIKESPSSIIIKKKQAKMPIDEEENEKKEFKPTKKNLFDE